ncbi:MAG: tRNA preQ1(34) S-adenosylmethionine ribosyltransferase-isomerase QueA [Desulfovibrionaceae bacterium]|nr:tRNA preQ1(34) S-adenosylmethionine ribosyltransferase-isomerase QueA [Desulfovibrionaceae bacterium]
MPASDIPKDFLLSNYQFPLPEDRIAQFPPENRSDARLLVFKRKDPTLNFIHTNFHEILKYLPPKALLVANNTKVLPARILGKRETGGKFEFLLLTPLPLIKIDFIDEAGFKHATCEGLLKLGSKVKEGLSLNLGENFTLSVLKMGSFGRHKVELKFKGELREHFLKLGQIPLPPYIKRPSSELDLKRYQTIYAREEGSVAAPTAGLHFTQEIKEQLLAKGFGWTEVTLSVGYGTFSPIRTPDIREHHMHPEYVEISPETADSIKQAKKEKRPLIAIGTTSLRALEGAFKIQGKIASFAGWTDIFLYPGEPFNLVDGLLTNFHLPGSSLILLVAAFVGRERILSVYREALTKDYRFFSYGDAMLILPDTP